MTKKNEDGAMMEMTDQARIRRRRILKAGAVIAPLAVTLHGGVAFAQVNSAGRCVEHLKDTLRIPTFSVDADGNYVQNGSVAFNPSPGAMTGRVIDGQPEDHWNYVIREQLAGQTCLQSFMASGETR